MKHQHFDRKLINEIKTSRDTSKHIVSHIKLMGKKAPDIWPVVTTLLDDDSMCLDVSQQW